jgi:formate hydrogenlyase subunit 3/multisubunit Na+/H+ antiporter MnhD subunit
MGAVDVRRRYVVPELFGYLVFRTGARFVDRMGTWGNFPRQLALCLFLFVLGVLILVGIPLSFVFVPLVYPAVRSSFNRYAKELAAPSS